MVEDATDALSAAVALDDWMRARDFAGWDPFDVLNSPLVGALSLGRRWPAVAWTQLGKRLPARTRPLLGVPPTRNPKTIGLVLAAYARLADATGDAGYRERAAGLVEWLADVTSAEHPGAGWGYPFPWANRAFFAPAGTPASVPTVFIAHGLLDAAERLDLPTAARLAVRAAEFASAALNRVPGADGAFCFSYTPIDERVVHNANVLTASLLARVGAMTGDAAARADALNAARFTVAAQRTDGAWPYGAARRDDWVDAFHTSYTLVALHRIGEALETDAVDAPIRRGADYWRRSFLAGPAVGPAPGATHPVDAHAVAHAIVTLLTLDPAAWRDDPAFDPRREALRLTRWCIDEMRDADGFFHYRKHRWRTERGPYMRWTQAWMLRALAEVAGDGPHAAPARAAAEGPDARQDRARRSTPPDDDTATGASGRPGNTETRETERP